MTDRQLLMAVPNVSEGRDLAALEAIERSLGPARFLDLHADPDHHRAVFTLAAPQGDLAPALLNLARAAIERIDISSHAGIHPHVGALDVMPVVYLDDERRGAACAEALTAAGLVGEELGVPVFLYGELATRPEHRERAAIRKGGPRQLGRRIEAGRARPRLRPARAPTRRPGQCWPRRGRRLLHSTWTSRATTSSSPGRSPPRCASRAAAFRGCARSACTWLSAAGRRSPRTSTTTARRRCARSSSACASAPRWPRRSWSGSRRGRRFEGFPDDVPLRGFDPERHLIEDACASLAIR